MNTTPFNLPLIRDYFNERNFHRQIEQKIYQSSHETKSMTETAYADSDIKRIFRSPRNYTSEKALSQAANAELSRTLQIMTDANHLAHEPFEFFTESSVPLPINRMPSPGILHIPRKFHFGRIVETTPTMPETGFPPHPRIMDLIHEKYPQYAVFISDYCRPLGTTDATFSDFNREQVPSKPIPKEKLPRILKHVKSKLAAKKYLPMHYVDTLFAKLPSSTGTGYHNRHSFRIRAHAAVSHPEEFADKPSSKGYYFNAFHEYSRYIIHLIKETGYPFEFTFSDPPTEDDDLKFITKLNNFMDTYPTLLFTRSHISKRNDALKQRPVYAADELFLLIECMLLFPLITQARSPDCCIMYGLETIRGANAFLDKLAQSFKSFFTIDWSAFDQRLPRVITDTFFTEFIPSLLVINHAYQPTYEYPSYPDLTPDKLYQKMSNLLSFLHLWYNNMSYLSQDGFGYRRCHAGVPSGILSTQYIDSYGNLFIIIDALIEFECTDEEIEQLLLLVMGDDNTGFTLWSITKVEKFILFLTKYSLATYNMVVSETKSVITSLREKIETLGYTCNFGRPTRPISKLVAQICLPERATKTKHMSSRAIGIAYASCACDYTFYLFCKDIFDIFKPYQDLTVTREVLIKFLPSQMMFADDTLPRIEFDVFPTFESIQEMVFTFQGPLSYSPKWDYSHFKHSPDYTPEDSQTLSDYRLQNGLNTPPAPRLM
jgi:hypothetical protein